MGSTKRTEINSKPPKIDLGVIVVIAISSLAAWAFLVNSSLPTGTDAEIHVFRAAQVKDAIVNGVLYPRWAPTFYYGNGYPIFNYYAPFAYHVAAYYSLLTGTDVVAGTKFVLVLSAYLGGLGMYLFARDLWGGNAGIVASTAWSFSPYIVFLEPHARGEVAETLALGIAPVVFWTFGRICQSGSVRFMAAGALSLAALIMSHPLAALAVYGLLLAYLFSQLLLAPLVDDSVNVTQSRKVIPLVVGALVFGLALAAMYWLPAGLERDLVRLDFYGKGHYDFRKHFIPITDLISPALWVDLGAAFPDFRFSLGPPQLIFGLLGSLTLLHGRLRQSTAVFLSLATLFSVYLMTDASLGMWEVIPPMRFFQFPMRFLGPAALTLAPLAGMAVRWGDLAKPRWIAGALTAVMIIMLVGAALPLTYPPRWNEFGEVSDGRIVAEELEGKWIGTTCCHDFLPVDVLSVPEPDPAIIEQYLAGAAQVEKFDREQLPTGVKLGVLESGPEHDTMMVDAPSAFDLKLNHFYFPGWKVTIDGKEAELSVTEPDGRMLVSVPAGRHELKMTLEPTAARRLGTGISLAAGLMFLVVVTVGWKRSALLKYSSRNLDVQSFGIAVLAIVSVICLKFASDQMGWFRHHSTGREVLVSENAYYASIESEIELLGFDGRSATVLPGDDFPVTLYWRASKPPTRNYQVYVHLRSADGRLWGQSDRLNPGGFPTSRWSTDKYIRDEHQVQVQTDTPPGNYALHVGLWNREMGDRYIAHDEYGLMLGDSVPLRVEIIVARRR